MSPYLAHSTTYTYFRLGPWIIDAFLNYFLDFYAHCYYHSLSVCEGSSPSFSWRWLPLTSTAIFFSFPLYLFHYTTNKKGLSTKAHLFQHSLPSCQFILKIIPLFLFTYCKTLHIVERALVFKLLRSPLVS